MMNTGDLCYLTKASVNEQSHIYTDHMVASLWPDHLKPLEFLRDRNKRGIFCYNIWVLSQVLK